MVKAEKLSPSEAWKLDYPEIFHILELQTHSVDTDISMMINAERKMNGARDPKYLIQ